MKDFGRTGGGNDTHGVVGWNFKFTDMQVQPRNAFAHSTEWGVQAVVGIEQMKKLPWRVHRMRQIYQLYKVQLRDVPQVSTTPTTETQMILSLISDIGNDERP